MRAYGEGAAEDPRDDALMAIFRGPAWGSGRARVIVVADLAGDVAEAGPGEPGGALGHDDVGGVVDRAQVPFLVEGAEDAGGQVVAAGLACGVGCACHRGGVSWSAGRRGGPPGGGARSGPRWSRR